MDGFSWPQAIITLLVAAIPAVVGWFVARSQRIQAGESAADAKHEADQARASVTDMERLRRLEERAREAKADMYLPLVKALGKMFEKTGAERSKGGEAKLKDDVLREINNFWPLAIIYASDDAQRAFGRMQQAFFHDAPVKITLRLYSEWLLAARRDLADEVSTLTPTEVWAPKINDIFNKIESLYGFDTEPLAALAEQAKWRVPWEGSILEHRPDEQFPRNLVTVENAGGDATPEARPHKTGA